MARENYDSIIIGAGHNGLVCASYLAKAGKRVLVLEAGEGIGGLAAAREFHPDFRAAIAHSVNHFSSKVSRDLDLAAHGFSLGAGTAPVTVLGEDDRYLTLDGTSLAGASAADQKAYEEFSRLMQRFARRLEPFWLKTMPRIGNNTLAELITFAHVGLNLKLLGREDMGEFLRIASLPVRDLMNEYFEDELLKVLLGWDGIIGSRLAPRSPNSSVITMLYRMSGKRGGGGLLSALRKAAESAGVEIRERAPVARIQVEGDSNGLRAKGVELEDGEVINALDVVSSADPRRTFLDLVGAEHLEIQFTNRIRRLRCEGCVAKLHLALSDLPQLGGLESPDGRLVLAPSLDAMEFAYDDAKYGRGSESPVMEVAIPSLHDSSLAPSGQHVLSAHVAYVPYRHREGWDDATRDTMCERAMATLARYAPGIRELVIATEFLTPADLERIGKVSGGHWHHAELAADQLLMMRPTYEAAQYRTPIPGLFLCGAGCHPGGDLTGAPGHNAAREILR